MSKFNFYLIILILASACTKTFSKTTKQPNPIFYASNPDFIKDSHTLNIIRGDHELYNFKLVNYAKFIVVSRDRINFKVEITHKWREYADPCGWNIYVKINKKKYEVECSKRKIESITRMWDIQRRRVIARNLYGDPILIEGFERNPTTLTSITVFVGKAHLTIYDRDIITPHTTKIELVLEKKQVRFVYTWNLENPK